ncbi:MAG: ribosome-associated translation inhibitor RaiA, partial [Negativicutes bacterium]|nr:ribosome-associated translation inhibitor RaiA [Negativicutes bacterium]
MAINVRGKNVDITQSLREYVEKRLKKIVRYFDNEADISVILAVEKGRHIVEVTASVSGVLLRGEESTSDMYA